MGMIGYGAHPFTGRIVRVSVKPLGITDDGFVIGRVTRTIDVGRPDPITIADPDAAMVEEPWEGKRPTGEETQAALQAKVVAHLTRFSGLRAKDIAAAIGEGYVQVCAHLSGGEGKVYCQLGKVGKTGRTVLWGLLGVDDHEG